MEPFAAVFLLFVGSLLALQAAANVQLSAAMASPFGASAVQLGIGAALLLAIAALAGSLGAFGLLDEAEPWQLAGGVGSALYITAGILLFPRLGALVAVGLFIGGQMLASLLLDGFGWLGVERRALDAAALIGALAVGAGVWLIVRAQTGARALQDAASERRWLVLGLTAGAVLPIQGAVNAQLNAKLDAATAVAALSFVVATSAMALAFAAILAAGAPRPRVAPLRGVPWWGWLGGLCGATYVTSVFSLIPDIGAEPVVVLTVAGQQLSSIAIDRYGLLRLPRRTISARRLAGVAVLLCGAAMITVL
jgi:bacterial/archaeal transporter family-2 protein